MVSTVSNSSAASASNAANSSALGTATSGQTQADNFLKLLVAQLNNQDPMNPMDNAQMTSQIAQINTVTGIQQLNTTINTMATQFTGMQVMQGSSMIGHNVVATGNTLSGSGNGALNLASDASNVTVNVTTPGGQLLDTVQLGALTAGNHNFTWANAASYTGASAPTFSVKATQAGQAVTATPLLLDTVAAVGTNSTGAMTLTLQSGNTVPYSTVQQIF